LCRLPLSVRFGSNPPDGPILAALQTL
jgi:hypothetical protein